MKVKGMRINDRKNGKFIVELPNILEKIFYENQLHGSIFFLGGMGNLDENIFYIDIEKISEESKTGYIIEWDFLNKIAKRFDQIFDGTFLGCKDVKHLRLYETDQEKYETCEIVIEMIDCGYWEIFTKDEELFNRFVAKFEVDKFLETDYQNEYYK